MLGEGLSSPHFTGEETEAPWEATTSCLRPLGQSAMEAACSGEFTWRQPFTVSLPSSRVSWFSPNQVIHRHLHIAFEILWHLIVSCHNFSVFMYHLRARCCAKLFFSSTLFL